MLQTFKPGQYLDTSNAALAHSQDPNSYRPLMDDDQLRGEARDQWFKEHPGQMPPAVLQGTLEDRLAAEKAGQLQTLRAMYGEAGDGLDAAISRCGTSTTSASSSRPRTWSSPA